MSPRQCRSLACVAMLWIAGCPDTHGAADAAVPPDAPPHDAWGDAAGADAFEVPRCQVAGRAVASDVEGSDFAGCSCPAGTIAGIGLRAPAPLAVEHGPFALCIPPRTAARIIPGLCGGGQVVHLFQGRRSETHGVDFVDELPDGDGCMDARGCLFAELQLPDEMHPGCVYPDYTIAETGIIAPTEDCDGLAADGLCSIDCPCTRDADLHDCFGMSETQPVGVCSEPPYCLPGALPCLGGLTCVMFFMEPEFASGMESAVPAGRCVPATSCEAFRARAGEEWVCHAPVGG